LRKRTWAAWRMSTRRLLPDRLVTGATPARHRSARSSRRCKASKASASSVARTIRPTPGKDRRIVTSHGSGVSPTRRRAPGRSHPRSGGSATACITAADRGEGCCKQDWVAWPLRPRSPAGDERVLRQLRPPADTSKVPVFWPSPFRTGRTLCPPAIPLAQDRGPRWRLCRSTGQAMFRSAATRRPSYSHQGTRRDGCLPLWPG
jgi:hypothetical protein